MKLSFPQILLIGVALIVGWFLFSTLSHVFDSARFTASTSQARSNLINLHKALTLYTESNDNRFPHGSTMTTHLAQIEPYLKKIKSFAKPTKDSSSPHFNFNLAGVAPDKSSNFARLGNPPLPISKTITYFCTIEAKNHHGAVITFADGKTKKQYSDNPVDLSFVFKDQFDRTGVTLAPADYLTK